ncbi:hypothetical protein RclHR1_02310017 [Rhizophagus clarus]|uniref:Patatin n=1 Tax=Rhizophagus clarus TaxID=94130 RepID=A0A2Z6RB82_9GLOM|nr:hypothetical protein RclHR1_02310017 [Rhizophagus clarus]GES87823.1 patatin [Rhizophagus clarus]
MSQPVGRIAPRSKKAWILSIDGGGIRGLIPSIILQKLEEVINERMDEKRKGGKYLQIADIFDMVAGTSTGSIIALGLTVSGDADNLKPKYPASELVNLYENYNDQIFNHICPLLRWFYPKYKPDKFEGLLKKKFSRKNKEVCTLNDIVNDVKVLVPSYNISTNEEVFFNNYPEFQGPNDYTSFSIPDVIRASTAAPTYFPAKEISNCYYIDGGVYMNNPSYFAYHEAKRIFQAEEYVICSLGTGYYQGELSQLKDGGPLSWLIPIVSLTMNSSSKLAENYFKNDDPDPGSNKLKVDFKYFPIRPTLKRNTPLDDNSKESIDSLKCIAEEYIKKEDFNNLVNKILNCWEPKQYEQRKIS